MKVTTLILAIIILCLSAFFIEYLFVSSKLLLRPTETQKTENVPPSIDKPLINDYTSNNAKG